jgi:hypothetical protein
MMLFKVLDNKICERRRFTISELSYEFSLISRTFLCKLIMARLGYHNFCARWVPKIPTAVHKKQGMAWALTFSSDTTEMSTNYPVSSWEWWNLGFICVCWHQKAVKAVDAQTYTKQTEKVLKTSVWQKADGNCFLEQEMSSNDGIHATTNNHVRRVLHEKH